MLVAMLDVKTVAVSRSPIVEFVPDMFLAHEGLRKIYAESERNVAGCQVVWEDVGSGRVEKRRSFKECDVVSWNFSGLGKIVDDL